MDRLRCFHFNDSKIELGGNRDRHANIGEGTIGAKGLAPLVGNPKIRNLPLLLEVPGSGEGPRAEDIVTAQKVVTAGIRLYDGAKKSPPAMKATLPKRAALTKKLVAPKKAAPKKAAPKKAAPKKFARKKAAPKKAAPKKAAPKKVAPKKAAKKTAKR
jgi:hypothetical protein